MAKAEADGDLKTLGGLIRECRECTVTVGRTIGVWSERPAVIHNDNRILLQQSVAALSTDELRQLIQSRKALQAQPDVIEGELC